MLALACRFVFTKREERVFSKTTVVGPCRGAGSVGGAWNYRQQVCRGSGWQGERSQWSPGWWWRGGLNRKKHGKLSHYSSNLRERSGSRDNGSYSIIIMYPLDFKFKCVCRRLNQKYWHPLHAISALHDTPTSTDDVRAEQNLVVKTLPQQLILNNSCAW
ncbi:hypothetical protein PoB_003510700 [Plakobranchus ocellatus]|uniref:Uncharacterized protein n=1 Tax=Plakobranchus ocellatus TaxID=259542 RepID=A0AAV4AMX4_9GAST|nr:hypothetical protein PoB_003510700 [Plakobranchus ocellatus]